MLNDFAEPTERRVANYSTEVSSNERVSIDKDKFEKQKSCESGNLFKKY